MWGIWLLCFVMHKHLIKTSDDGMWAMWGIWVICLKMWHWAQLIMIHFWVDGQVCLAYNLMWILIDEIPSIVMQVMQDKALSTIIAGQLQMDDKLADVLKNNLIGN